MLVQDLDLDPSLTALCGGYEQGEWRAEGLARHLFDWLPEFALNWTERQKFSDTTAVELMRRAAQVVYQSDKYSRRGEFGELILHAACRQVFESEPAISKLYYKDSANDTVKGFDAVHVVFSPPHLEMWLGEAKFYRSRSSAIAAIVEELEKHTDCDYLRGEFALITNKIDENWPYADKLKSLLHPNTSLDDVFDRVRIPVLITYESDCVGRHQDRSESYVREFEDEVREAWAELSGKELPALSILLILVPIKNKKNLIDRLHERLKAWQGL